MKLVLKTIANFLMGTNFGRILFIICVYYLASLTTFRVFFFTIIAIYFILAILRELEND